MLRGRMYIQFRDERHEVGPGEVCVLPTIATPHSFENIEGEVELKANEFVARKHAG